MSNSCRVKVCSLATHSVAIQSTIHVKPLPAYARKALRTRASPDTIAELTPMGPAAAPLLVEVVAAEEVGELPALFVSLIVAEAVGEAEVGYVLPAALISKGSDRARILVRSSGLVNAMV